MIWPPVSSTAGIEPVHALPRLFRAAAGQQVVAQVGRRVGEVEEFSEEP